MAIGFALSAASEIELDDVEGAIYFQLKNVRYKMVIDDINKAKEVVMLINGILERYKNIKQAKAKELPEFYKG